MKVLVVEDEHKIANSIKKGLEQELFIVDVAYDGIAAYDLSTSEEYDVIVLDLMLPGMDGMEICRNLRKEGNHTPILILTARGELEDRVNGLNSGADDYLVKPFAFNELLARVKALTRRPKTTVKPKLMVDDLVLDLDNFVVKRNNIPIRTSKKEFSLLSFMMRNSGKILTKDAIIQRVWDYEANILPNTVEVYITSLRKKIDKAYPDAKPLIHTVRGFGYKIGN